MTREPKNGCRGAGTRKPRIRRREPERGSQGSGAEGRGTEMELDSLCQNGSVEESAPLEILVGCSKSLGQAEKLK